MYVFMYSFLLFLSDFDETWICWIDFSKNLLIPNFMKIRPVGADLFHADGRTDSNTDRHAFRNLRTRLKTGPCTLLAACRIAEF
jgi:hypothetical protein